MSKLILASLMMIGSTGAALAQTATPTPVAPASTPAGKVAFSTEETDIGTLLDNPATKAILDKHIPGFSANPQVDMGRSLTLKGVQPYASDQVTDDVLKAIDADFAKLPAGK